jgi:Phosphatidylserine synthase
MIMANCVTKHIPNTLTCCNLLSGCMAVIAAFNCEPWHALLWIVSGALFDFCDGLSARLLKAYSPIGKELDSLADLVTFGLAPSVLCFTALKGLSYPCDWLAQFYPYIGFALVTFAALRLAKFNIDERQTTSFLGLAVPANALFWGSLIVGFGQEMMACTYILPLLIIGIVVSSWLLIAEIPMFALKFKHWGFKGNEIKYGFVIFSALALIGGIAYGIVKENIHVCYLPFCIIILAYIAVSIATQKK